jgi:hypothetical protein
MKERQMDDLVRQTLMEADDELFQFIKQAVAQFNPAAYRPSFGMRADALILVQYIERLKEEIAFLKGEPA